MAFPAAVPGLVMLGAPKCGTSTLASWWREHPEGFTAPGKEVGFFTAEWDRGLGWYRSRFEGALPGQVTCDASPGYLYSDEALDRMAAVLPDARLAVVLRDPVSRVWSHWCYLVALGLEPRDFATALAQELADPSTTPPGFPIGYLTGSRYVRRLEAVTQRFDRSQLLVLLTDELHSDPVGTFAALCAHGGIAPGTPGERRNEGRFPRYPQLQQRLGGLRQHPWTRRPGRRLMELNLRPGPPPALPRHHEQQLREALHGEVEALSTWLERELPARWYGDRLPGRASLEHHVPAPQGAPGQRA